MTIQNYLAQVADAMPRMMPEREQILADVRTHIEQDIQRGETLDAVLAKLGDPARLAASYLSELPLAAASFWPRVAAKAVDLAILAVIAAPFAALAVVAEHKELPLVVLADTGTVAVVAGVAICFMIGESRFGQTPGKHWLKLLVVRESGARISFGQAIVRQLPWLLHIWWVDAIFALFTERHQRAFELLSKTRVITIDPALDGEGG